MILVICLVKNKECELLLFDTCCSISRNKGKSEREIVKSESLGTSQLGTRDN